MLKANHNLFSKRETMVQISFSKYSLVVLVRVFPLPSFLYRFPSTVVCTVHTKFI